MKGGRPSIEAELRAKVTGFLAQAITLPPAQQPISLRAVALAVGHDRRVLKKYELDRQIELAAQQQRRQHRSAAGRMRTSLDESLLSLREAVALRTQQYEKVIALLALTEANARRLGIDPDELHRALPVPDRSVAATYQHKPRRRD